ncbi:MAG: aminoacetone oxidase family FAD-binding enzyme [Eubacteriales bacterium]|nr:aminoacetone oxidase family FAD-binding enzyme [Eubacteriales bacterium]
MVYDVVIVGAGASGLCAAYQIAKKKSNCHILILEKASIAGRKLSAAGNGKCNLTNTLFGNEHYYSQDDACIKQWCDSHSYQMILDFFETMGVLLYEKDGYYYPLSNQAKQVTEYLVAMNERFGVEIQYETSVSSISLKQNHYIVYACKNENKISFQASKVILATGGLAAPQLGGTKDGYRLAKEIGIKTSAIFPALTPAFVEDSYLKIAKGVRLDAVISLRGQDGIIKKERGQLQINDDSLSGIAMMNMSCLFNKYPQADRKDCIMIDVVPEYTWNRLKTFMDEQRNIQNRQTIIHLLSGILPTKFNKYLLKRLNIKEDELLENITEKQCNRMVSALKKLTFTPIVFEDYKRAQVTNGGVLLSEIDLSSFECNQYQGVYVVGELLDVTGECGGYNLSFAVLSGICAGNHIADSLT